MAAPARRRLAYIDALNVIASFAVVMLHLNYCVWLGPEGPSWVSAIIIETLFVWAVPVFFMNTGTTLMDYRKRMSTKEFFRRRFERTVVPWVFWSLMGLAFTCYLASEFGTAEMPYLGPRSIFNDIAESKYIEFYWFFPALFSMYLSLPVLSALKNRDSSFRYIIAMGILFSGVLPLVGKLINTSSLGSFAPPMALGYTLYVLIGYQLSHWKPSRQQRLGIYAAGVVGWLAQLAGTMALSTVEAGVSTVFKGQFSPFAVAQAVAVYVLVRHAGIDEAIAARPALGKALQTLSSVTFGIYLMHWFVLRWVQNTMDPDPHDLAFRLLGAFAIYWLCAGFTFLLKRIPVVRRIVP